MQPRSSVTRPGQVVLTLPKRLRAYFLYDRRRLGLVSRVAVRMLRYFVQAAVGNREALLLRDRLAMDSAPQLALMIAALALALASGAAAEPRARIGVDDPSWQLESDANGIALYGGAVPGIGIVPLKVVMTIPGTIEEVSLVLEDISRRHEWISNFGRSVLLERVSDYDQVEYLHVDVPWPVADRSALVRARITVSDDLKRITIAAESEDVHAADTLPRLVRARVYASTFQMTQRAGAVEVVALIFIDPRGSIPKWVVNYFARRGSRMTLTGLRRQVARHLYSPAQIAGMHERMRAYRAYRESRVAAP